MKKMKIMFMALAIAFTLTVPTLGHAITQMTIAWTPATQPSGVTVDHFNLYLGTTSGGESGAGLNMGNVSQYTVTGLTNGQAYYWWVTAVDTFNNESIASNEGATVLNNVLPPGQNKRIK